MARQAINNSRATTPTSVPAITRIQVEGNDTVSFLYGTTPPYQYIRGMSQILEQSPAYISYRYDTITISQVAGESFTFTVYGITDVGGNTFTALTSQDPSDVVLAKTQEIYRLLVTSVFKGCCECGNTEPECSIQYTAGDSGAENPGIFVDGGSAVRFNYFTANNQDFTGFWPIVQDGSWVFIFSKTDPTVYGVYQLSNYSDGGAFAQFDSTLITGPAGFPAGTSLCVDVTSVGGSLVQDWQDTLNISSLLTQDNLIDGGDFNFEWENVKRYIITSSTYQSYLSTDGFSTGQVYIDSGSVSITGTTFIDVITPNYATATAGMVLALDSSGHVEYTLAGTGTISSIGLFMPPAFTVSTPNPLISNGDFTVTGAGTDLEYINGLGELATLPVYTVENGLHAFGGVPGETPPDPFLFHLGGELVEDTVITTTNGTTEYVLGIAGTANQNSRRPLAVSNLGLGGAAVFSDYSSGFRANASVQMLTDNDLFQPILDLTMQGDLPAGGILADRTTMLRLKYDGAPAVGARTSIDYQFKNDDIPPNNPYFIAGRLTTEITNFTANAEESNFELQLFSVGSRGNKLVMEGKGQLELTNYATGFFWNGDTNINNSLTYVLAVDGTGKVWKKEAEGGGTVQEVDTEGLITGGPITTTGTITTSMATSRLVGRWDTGTGIMQEIVIGSGLTLTGDTLTADGGTGFDVQVNDTTIIPPATILNLKSGTDIDVVYEGSGAVRFDWAGTPGATYNSNEGIYKDTSGSPETFQLGAPSGLQSTMPFSVDRYINTKGSSLNFQGNPDGGNIINIVANTGTNTSRGISVDYTNSNKSTAFYGTVATGGVGLEIGNSGTGFDIKQIGASKLTTNSPVPGIALAMEFVNPGNTASGDGVKINLLNNTIESYYTNGTFESNLRFSVRPDGISASINSLELDGTLGQVRFNQYGQTPAKFPDATPVWALGVDSTGNVVEFTPGTGSSPLTTKGDIYTFGTADARLPVGTNGYILSADSAEATGLKWVSAPSGSGITTINGATEAVQEFFIVFGDTGESTPTIITSGGDHTIHIPYADGGRDGVITADQFLDFSAKVPDTRTLTINGTGYDLTADRSWTVDASGTAGGDLTGTYPNPTVVALQGNSVSDATPATGQTLQWSGTDWVPGAIPNGGSGGGGVVYYFNYQNTTDISPTTGLPTTPVPPSQLGITYSVGAGTITSADLTQGSYDLICGFVTIVGTPGVIDIPAGLWDFNIWVDVIGSGPQANQTQFQVRVYKYNSSTGVYTSLANSDDVYIYDPITTAQYIANVTMPQTTILVTDRIYIELWGQKNVPLTRQIRFYFDSLHPSHVHTTLPSVAGTGLVKVVNGVYQSPAATLVDADVAVAAISVNRLTMNTAKLLGRTTASAGSVEEIGLTTTGSSGAATLSAGNLNIPTYTLAGLGGAVATIGVTVDGSGGTITAGQKGYVRIPYACTITSWSILTGNAGTGATITFDIWRANNAIPTVANSLVGAGTKPFLTSNTAQITSAAPTGWTSVAVAANDILGFNVEVGAAVFSLANLQLTVTRT